MKIIAILVAFLTFGFSCSENGKKGADSEYISTETKSHQSENKSPDNPLDTIGFSQFFSSNQTISFEELYRAGNSTLILFQTKKSREDTSLLMDSLQNPAFSNNLVSAFERIKETSKTSKIKVVINKNLHIHVTGNDNRAIGLVNYGGEKTDQTYNGFIFFDFNHSKTFLIGFNRLAGSIPSNNKIERTYFILTLTDGFLAETGAFFKDGIAEKMICAEGKNLKYYDCLTPNPEMKGSLQEFSMKDIESLFEKSCTQSSLTKCGQLNWEKIPAWNNIW
jgi:hypothetical protein